MSNQKITQLTALTTATANDVLPIVDVLDTTMASSGTDKKITVANIFTSPTIVTPTIASFVNAQHTHQNNAGGGPLTEAALSLSNVTTADVSTTAHGFAPILPNNATTFLRGDGTYAAPTSTPLNILVDTTGTLSLTTTVGQKVMVWASGSGTGSNGYVTTLAYNGTPKHITSGLSGTGSYNTSFSLMYTETPGGATANITLTSTGTITNIKIMVLIIG